MITIVSFGNTVKFDLLKFKLFSTGRVFLVLYDLLQCCFPTERQESIMNSHFIRHKIFPSIVFEGVLFSLLQF